MADNSNKQDDLWPMPKYHFSVDLGDGSIISFQEISGIGMEASIIDYRAGNSPRFSPIKMPGMVKYGNITMKKGVTTARDNYSSWYLQMTKVEKRNITVSLLDENNKPMMRWQLKNAFPTKITASDLKSSGNEVAIESLELIHEGVTIVDDSQ